MKRVIGKGFRGGDIVGRLGLVLVCLSGWAESSITITPTYVNSAGETWTSDRIAVFEQAIDEWESSLAAPLSEGSVNIDVTVNFQSGIGSQAQWTGTLTGLAAGVSTRPWERVSHEISFNVDFMDPGATNHIWWDPTPADGSAPPFPLWDGLTLARHELGHLLGVTDFAYRDDFFLGSEVDLWKTHITSGSTEVFDAGGLNVTMAGPGDLKHVADSGTTAGDLMVAGLVNGVRKEISETDLQMLALAYDYVLIPEPGVATLMPLALVVVARRRRGRG